MSAKEINKCKFLFSCIKNCQERVNPDEKLIIESTCTANCYGQLELKWILFWFDNIDMPEPFDLSELNEVGAEVVFFLICSQLIVQKTF